MKFIAEFADDRTAIIETVNSPVCSISEIEIATSTTSTRFIIEHKEWNKLHSVSSLREIVKLADGNSFSLVSVDSPIVYQLSYCYVTADYQSIFYKKARII